MATDSRPLHIAFLPWLAAGHLTPYFGLATRVALLGHRVSFLSTPPNLLRLPSSDHHNLLHLVPLTPSVRAPVASTSDLTDSTEHLRPLLRRAYDSLSGPLADFLSSAVPPVDWLLCDYAPYWAIPVAKSLNVRTAFLSIYNAAVLAFLGPPDDLINPRRLAPEDFTAAPAWVPFPTSVAFRLPEARTVCGPTFAPDAPSAGGVSEAYRFGATIKECDLVAVRSCVELEAEWLDLLKDIYGGKTVLPTGHFPPAPKESVASLNEWAGAFEWLDKRAHGSVVYVAFGSEVRLNKEQVHEVARGLELSGLPFIWALRWPDGLAEALPEGFEARTADRGIVCHGWVPQVGLLSHPAVGGLLTHSGWGSVTEGLLFGLALILVPMVYDQALNARLLEEKRVGKEVPRNDEDGAFDGIGISKTLRLVMVEEGGKGYRARCRELKNVIGSKEVQDSYVTKFVEHLKCNRPAMHEKY